MEETQNITDKKLKDAYLTYLLNVVSLSDVIEIVRQQVIAEGTKSFDGLSVEQKENLKRQLFKQQEVENVVDDRIEGDV